MLVFVEYMVKVAKRKTVCLCKADKTEERRADERNEAKKTVNERTNEFKKETDKFTYSDGQFFLHKLETKQQHENIHTYKKREYKATAPTMHLTRSQHSNTDIPPNIHTHTHLHFHKLFLSSNLEIMVIFT